MDDSLMRSLSLCESACCATCSILIVFVSLEERETPQIVKLSCSATPNNGAFIAK